MKLLGCFEAFGAVDVGNIKSLLNLLTSNEWEAFHERRKEMAGDRVGHAIPIITYFWPTHAGHFERGLRKGNVNVLKSNLHPDLVDETISFCNTEVLPHFKGALPFQVQYTTLGPTESIRTHKDGFPLTFGHRLHVPISTNELVIFEVGDQQMHLDQGHLYEIDNTKPHAVSNKGDTTRIHLVIDLLPTTFGSVTLHNTVSSFENSITS